MTIVFDIHKTNNPIEQVEITLILGPDEEQPRMYEMKAVLWAAIECLPENPARLKTVRLEKKECGNEAKA